MWITPSKKDSTKSVTGQDRHILMLFFQPTHVQIGKIFTTKCFEVQKSKLVQKAMIQKHEGKVHQKLLITVLQMKHLTSDPKPANFLVSRIEWMKGHLHLFWDY